MPAKPLRMALGSLLIQKQYRYSDEELVEQLRYCGSFGILISGKRLGPFWKDADSKAENKIAYKDNTDRIEVERKFSLAKRKFSLVLLLTKREDTTRSSITLISVIAMNIDRLAAMLLRLIVHLLECLSENRDLGLTGEVWVVE